MQKVGRVLCQIMDFVGENILDALLLAFALFIIFSHIQDVYNKSAEPKLISIWSEVWMDMLAHPDVYIPFFVLFLFWLTYKIFKFRRSSREQERLVDVLERVVLVLNRLEERLDDYDNPE